MDKRAVVPAAAFGTMLVLAFLTAPVPALDEATTSFLWEAPLDATGPGVFRITLDLGEDNGCSVRLGAAGNAHLGPVALYRHDDSNSVLRYGEPYQAHSEALGLDTRTEPDETYHEEQISMGSPMNGQKEFVLAITDMQSVDGRPPAVVHIMCGEPFHVLQMSAGREAVSFDEGTMDGTGASANVVGIRGAVNLMDRAEAAFEAGDVEVAITHHGDSAAVFSYTLQTPGIRLQAIGPSLGGTSYYHDGPGDYALELTQAAAGARPALSVWMLGTEPVDSFDEVFS